MLSGLLALTGLTGASAGRLSAGLLDKVRAHDNAPTGVIVRFGFSGADNAQGRQSFKALRRQLKNTLAALGPEAGFVNTAMKRGGAELWLYQSVYLQLSPVQALQLSTLPVVDEVFENFKVQLPKVQTSTVKALSAASAPTGTPDPLRAVGAPQAWSAGFKGKGVRIGHLDTGIDAGHPELKGKLAAFAEFDANGDRVAGSKPHDSAQHGTHTAGLLVGKTVGMAPEARLISALVLPGGEGTFAQVIAGMQWVLDPDNNADTDDGANVVSMSLGLPGTSDAFVVPVQNMLRAGVVPVFAVGNFGPQAESTGSPGNIPDAVGVGAVDAAGKVASFSSRGPVNWSGAIEGSFIKPDVAAPGVGITSSFPGGKYGVLSGSSQAAPIVAGAVAVMRGARPDSSVPDLKQALFESASNKGKKDNQTGYGLINLPGALGKLGVQLASGAAGTPAAGQNPPPKGPAGYRFCVLEGQECKFSGQKQVAFGAAGRYLSGLTTDGFRCTVAEWGSDPVPGKAKACYIKDEKAAP